MAKHGRRVVPARRKQREDDSLLIKSAESLGRVIGSLQRQMHGRAKRLAALATDAMEAMPSPPRVDNPFATSTPRKPRSTRTARARKSSAGSKTAGSRKRSASTKSSKKR